MDEVIFEEFKGTGNSDIVLSRDIANRRVYPALDILKSGTRKEELLLDKDTLQKLWAIRNVISQMNDIDGLKFLFDKITSTRDNDEFLNSMNDLK